MLGHRSPIMKNLRWLFAIHALAAVAWVCLFFYLDEGLNSWAWMRNPGAWLVFSIYTLGALLFGWLVFLLIKRWLDVRLALIMTALTGTFAGFWLVALLLFAA